MSSPGLHYQPNYPFLNLGHPLAQHCVGAYFFGVGCAAISNIAMRVPHLLALYPNTAITKEADTFGPVVRYNPLLATDPKGWIAHKYYGPVATSSSQGIGLANATAAMFSIRMTFDDANKESPSFTYLFERTTTQSLAVQGWACYLELATENLSFFYNTQEVLRGSVSGILGGGWYHVVFTVAVGRNSVTDLGSDIYVNGVASNILGAVIIPSITGGTGDNLSNVIFGTPRATGFAWPGKLDHFLVYRKDTPNALFTEEEVKLVFDDPYAPFRPSVHPELFEVSAVAPSEFAAHRMHLA